jgi:hypothetical protein
MYLRRKLGGSREPTSAAAEAAGWVAEEGLAVVVGVADLVVVEEADSEEADCTNFHFSI